jgi:hypothetical protein
MAKRSQHWSPAASVDRVALEPGSLYMFRSTVAGATGGYSELYAYFLVRPAGNCLFHGPHPATFYREQRDFFDAHGGIALQVCSHTGDVSQSADLIEETWGAPLYINRWDARGVSEQLGRTVEGFVENVGPGPDLGAIYTPGHSLGFHSFRWSGAQGSYLFASHLIERRASGSRWIFALHPILKDAGLRALERLRGIDVDFLLPLRTQGRDLARGPRAPLPFGKLERETAVDQATAEVHAKLRRREAKARARGRA